MTDIIHSPPVRSWARPRPRPLSLWPDRQPASPGLTAALAAALILVITSPGSAQNSQVEQIQGAAAAPAGDISQIGTRSRDIGVPQSPERGRPAPPAQLSATGDARPAPSQLTSEIGRVSASQQLYKGGPTAQQPEPLSSPAEGRTGAVAPVEGNDRCDPRNRDRLRDPVCARVIERRAAEFSPPEPAPLSAEQRLLAEQRVRETGAQAAARRLASGAADPNSPDAQGIASLVLGTKAAPTEAPDAVDAEMIRAAEVAAVLGTIVTPPPK